MNARRLFLFVTVVVAMQLIIGCTMFDIRDENLPAGRNVKTVEFPVRHITFSDIECRQEYEKVTLSGTITNASPYDLTDVGVKIIIFFAEAERSERISPYRTSPAFSPVDPSANSKTVSIPATPSALYPRESATFEMLEEVDRPVARIEIHGFWTKAN